MNDSLQEMNLVPAQLLEERLETVRELQRGDYELYELSKDRETGEHYVHYAYLHRDVAAGGAEETYHQLMPISSDDVLGILFNDQPYTYPGEWSRAFLRNGPDGTYVWFQPETVSEDDEAFGRRLREELLRFKQQGSYDEASVRRLLGELNDEE